MLTILINVHIMSAIQIGISYHAYFVHPLMHDSQSI